MKTMGRSSPIDFGKDTHQITYKITGCDLLTDLQCTEELHQDSEFLQLDTVITQKMVRMWTLTDARNIPQRSPAHITYIYIYGHKMRTNMIWGRNVVQLISPSSHVTRLDIARVFSKAHKEGLESMKALVIRLIRPPWCFAYTAWRGWIAAQAASEYRQGIGRHAFNEFQCVLCKSCLCRDRFWMPERLLLNYACGKFGRLLDHFDWIRHTASENRVPCRQLLILKADCGPSNS